MRVFLELAYDGTRYHGWQRQPESITVQEVLEETLARLFGGPCPVMGCGRTDTGVHAKYYVAHVQFPDEVLGDRVASWEEATLKLNGLLPSDIGIYAMHQVGEKAHARFDATERGYTYYVHNVKDPFLEGRSTRIYGNLDVEAIEEACQHLVQKGDFSSFCKAGTGQGTTICDVRSARWETLGPHRWAFHITADRFLRNMVRATVGTLLDVGKGKLSPSDLPAILAAKDRRAAGKSVLGCGLYLTQVKYPDNVFSPEGVKYL
ncbi:MAG: tRNA pseudouridine(38-40) synthase TruA [Bacteroidetes bacterium]|nr:tRNA pseudouridine(38-40) synthase TruA [Bacteroidota bacterium]